MGVCVTTLVTNANKLKELVMENCTLQGDDEDFQDFELALMDSESLKTLRIMDCTVANPKIKLTDVVDSYKKNLMVAVEA